VAGRSVIFTSTNGTQAILRASRSRRIYIVALINVVASAQAIADELDRAGDDPDVLLLCSGRKGGRATSLEDTVCAGALATHLLEHRPTMALTDGAELARQLYTLHRANLGGLLAGSQSGRYLAKIGYAEDVGLFAHARAPRRRSARRSLLEGADPTKLLITRLE